MPVKKTTKKKKPQKMDKKLVAVKQKHEVKHAAKKSGKSQKAVRAAVKKVGRSRKKVMQELSPKEQYFENRDKIK